MDNKELMELFLDFTLVSGIVIISIIILLLVKSKKKQLSQHVLIIFFALLLSVTLFFYANLHGIHWLSRLAFIPSDVTAITIGPLLYLYIKSLFLEESGLVKKVLIHFSPVALYMVCIAIPTLMYSILKIEALSYVISEYIFIVIRTGDVFLVIYLILSLHLLSKYRGAIKSKDSNLSAHDFNWIKIMLSGALFIISIDLIAKIYKSFSGDTLWYQEYLIIVAMIILVFFLGYFGVNQSKVLVPDFLLNEDIFKKKKLIKNNVFSEVQEQDFKELKSKLEAILIKNESFLDEDLTLEKLASQLSTTDKKLSILLNQYMEITFYDFINKHRVTAVIEKMKLGAYENYNLFGIATECGFKSRTSFNRIFKKETGFSPSAFKARLS